MKKVFAIAAALMMLATAANAQSFGAGYVQSTANSASSNGFYAGFGYSAEIMPGLNLNPGLYYELLTSSTGASLGSWASYSGKTTEHYVNVPLHLSYGINFAPTFKVFAYGGPTANVGIASSTKVSGSVLGFGGSDTIDNYKDSNYGRFDIMLGVGGGVELMRKFRITVGYDWGMLDRDNRDNVVLKRNRLTAGAAFIF